MFGRFISELFRGNGIHHAATCTSRQPFLGPVRSVQSRIDAFESPSGETTYTCTECGRLAVWRDGVVQPDPVWEREHAEVRARGEAERAAAEDALTRQAPGTSPADAERPPVNRKKGRPPGSGLRIASREAILEPYRRLAAEKRRPPTQVELADNLHWPRTTLTDALKRFGLGWPPE
jgi:hypothetical protein